MCWPGPWKPDRRARSQQVSQRCAQPPWVWLFQLGLHPASWGQTVTSVSWIFSLKNYLSHLNSCLQPHLQQFFIFNSSLKYFRASFCSFYALVSPCLSSCFDLSHSCLVYIFKKRLLGKKYGGSISSTSLQIWPCPSAARAQEPYIWLWSVLDCGHWNSTYHPHCFVMKSWSIPLYLNLCASMAYSIWWYLPLCTDVTLCY